jgi:hypothetical protein
VIRSKRFRPLDTGLGDLFVNEVDLCVIVFCYGIAAGKL